MSVEIALGSAFAGFRIERLLGRGAMGAVYLAEDQHLKRKVAVKVIGPELAGDERFRRRFLLESQLAASLEHAHIVPIYAAGEEGDVLFLAMKYVEGYDLRELIDASDRVGDERALNLLAQVGDALDSAHGLGLVHRDVKPANILIGSGEAEHAYLCDFGLARHASTVASLTGEPFVGTIAYIAPEQIESGAVDARADVYALGCVLFECLTGVPPFEREGDLQVVFAHLKEPPPLVTSFRPDLSEAIDGVIEKALAKAPDDRFSTCAELVAEAAEAMQAAPPEVPHSVRRTVAGVRTFLITDIRGYTRYTNERGDEAAAALASGFAEIVRQVVEERDGRLIELRGDEALVVFDSARQAVRSAVELQARVVAAELPLGIGIGLDAGEAVPVGEGYRGGALNLAARLCSLAGPGETLATETVVQLARAVDEIQYGERRVERVKGIAKPVTAVEVLAADRRTSRFERARLKRAAKRTTRKPVVRIAAIALVIGIAVAAAVLGLAGSGSAHAAIAQRSVGIVSASGKLQGQLPVGGLGDLGLVDGQLWFVNQVDKTVERIDPTTRKLVHPFVSVDNIAGSAFGFHAVWAVDPVAAKLVRIDPRYHTVQQVPLGVDKGQIDLTAPTGAAVGAGSVWVALANTVVRVDPNTLRVVKRIDVEQADQVMFGDGLLWVVSDNTSKISAIDPSIDKVVRTIQLHDWINSVAVGGGFLWATVIPDDELWKMDENGTVRRTFDIGHQPGPVVLFKGQIWVGSDGKLSRVDPSSDRVTDFPILDRPAGMAAGAGALYVSTDESPPTLPKVDASKTATFSLSEDFIDDPDPAHAWPSAFAGQLEYATGAQLLNYPDAPAPAGLHLRPDVAAAMPTVSDGGRTYTFRVRPGFRFSPPSNQSVTAATFAYSIERALSPRLGQGTPGIEILGDVVGADAFHAGKAQHVSGITVSGNTLRIRLVAPAGDFLTRLSMPFFSAVPIGTPIVDGGVKSPIPSAGPYYIKLIWGSDLTVLVRNPNYHGSRPHRLERIVYDKANGTHRTVSRIKSGQEDYTADFLGDTTYAPGSPLARRFGSEKATGPPAPLLVQTPQLALAYLAFNTTRGIFRDVKLRRAVAMAIDRTKLAAQSGAVASDHLLPLPLSSPPLSLYPASPDVAGAKALVGVKPRKAVLYVSSNRPGRTALAEILAANLAPLGIALEVKKFDAVVSAMSQPGADYDLADAGWGFDWPDPSDFLNLAFTATGFRPSWAAQPLYPVPPAYARRLDEARTLLGTARTRAYARLDRELAREVVPIAVYGTAVMPEFFSARMGCRVEQPITGMADIGALCVRKS